MRNSDQKGGKTVEFSPDQTQEKEAIINVQRRKKNI